MKTGIELIAEERQRQIDVEGWMAEHDDRHIKGELANAAACYARYPHFPWPNKNWPWSIEWWKPTPKNRIRELQKAGALVAAEIDRLLRIETNELQGSK